MSRLAFDIETVSPDLQPDERPTFDDPGDFEFLIAGLGYQAEPGGPVETELFFRDGWGPDAELDVIDAALDWLESHDADAIVTYNGENFDFVHLLGRAEIAGDATGRDDVFARAQAFMDGLTSIDVRNDARDAYGGYPSLEDVCSKNDVDAPKTLLTKFGIDQARLDEQRPSAAWGQAHIVNTDVPILGEQYLDLVDDGETDSEAFESLRAALDHYARTDIEPLFELADKRPFATAPQ